MEFKVYRLTENEADSLRGQSMPNGAMYNVDVRDRHGNIIISKEQYEFAQVGEEIYYEPVEIEEEE